MLIFPLLFINLGMNSKISSKAQYIWKIFRLYREFLLTDALELVCEETGIGLMGATFNG